MADIDNRRKLHETLLAIMENNHVYFQPPETVKMVYPAIRYVRNAMVNEAANNQSAYLHKVGYQLTLIDTSPDSKYIEKLLALPLCSFDRHYASDNLNHDVFTIYI